MASFTEKREEPRFEGVYAEYAVITSGEETSASFKAGFLRNFSTGGASLFVHEKPPQGVLIKVRLYEPHSSRPVELTGGIVWAERSAESPTGRERYNIGLKFLNLEEAIRRRLDLMSQYFESEKNRAYTITGLIDAAKR